MWYIVLYNINIFGLPLLHWSNKFEISRRNFFDLTKIGCMHADTVGGTYDSIPWKLKKFKRGMHANEVISFNLGQSVSLPIN